MVKRSLPLVKYSPTGKGNEVFERLKQDPRIRVMPVTDDDQALDYQRNVCSWINYRGREFAVGRPNVNAYLGALGRELGITFRQYRTQEANV